MKTKLEAVFLGLLVVISGAQAMAASAVSADGSVFGVAPGVYRGTGRLISQVALAPDMDFVSIRKIENGIIEAETVASLCGHQVAKASAKLRILPRAGANYFAIIDVDSGKVAGSGACSEADCTFTATVMNGKLKLTETWKATADGFSLVNGSQKFFILPATYESDFVRVK